VSRKEQGLKLRALLASTGYSGMGRLYSAELRRAVVEFADAAVAEGRSQLSVARELGISAANIGRWRRGAGGDEGRTAEMCRVQLEEPSRGEQEEGNGGLVVRTASGLHIYGLTFPELTALVRAVR
jgi:transposase-like protein